MGGDIPGTAHTPGPPPTRADRAVLRGLRTARTERAAPGPTGPVVRAGRLKPRDSSQGKRVPPLHRLSRAWRRPAQSSQASACSTLSGPRNELPSVAHPGDQSSVTTLFPFPKAILWTPRATRLQEATLIDFRGGLLRARPPADGAQGAAPPGPRSSAPAPSLRQLHVPSRLPFSGAPERGYR